MFAPTVLARNAARAARWACQTRLGLLASLLILTARVAAEPPATQPPATEPPSNRWSPLTLAVELPGGIDAQRIIAGGWVDIRLRRAGDETQPLLATVRVRSVERDAASERRLVLEVADHELLLLRALPAESLHFAPADKPRPAAPVPEAALLRALLPQQQDQPEPLAATFRDRLLTAAAGVLLGEKTQVQRNYVFNPKPTATADWAEVAAAMQAEPVGRDRSLLLRVFLEEPQPSERISLQALNGVNMFYPEAAPGEDAAHGVYHQIAPAGFSGVSCSGGEALPTLRVASPYHLPFEILLPARKRRRRRAGGNPVAPPAAGESGDDGCDAAGCGRKAGDGLGLHVRPHHLWRPVWHAASTR